jgi:anthranilate synthase component 1
VNPSPYQIYLQGEGAILVASSPEILCRVHGGVVTNRPLAGTRPRGRTLEEDIRLESELLADAKERAEHVMLVDLGRNDSGRVCETGTVSIDRCMEVERYSHVMHISSTLTGRLRADCDAFDALRATLPVGTVSGAPKVRAIEIIDELEPTRRGPYSGGIGAVGYSGDMDIALALEGDVLVVRAPARARARERAVRDHAAVHAA